GAVRPRFASGYGLPRRVRVTATPSCECRQEAVAEGSTRATFALIGPGRAGATVALALVARGYTATAVAGRAPDAASTTATAACLDAKPVLVSKAGRGAAIVIIATPDAAIEATAVAVAPSLRRDALVVHLAGSLGLDVFAPLLELRPDVRVGAL